MIFFLANEWLFIQWENKGELLVTYNIKKAAVLGSGVMGSGIAAHLANIGIPTLLLDIAPKELTADEEAKGLSLEHPAVRNRIVNGALQKLVKQKPAPLTSKKNLSLLTVGNFEDDLGKLKDVDWIIEVVVENLAIKQSLYEKKSTLSEHQEQLLVQTLLVLALMQWLKGAQKIFKSISWVLISSTRHAI